MKQRELVNSTPHPSPLLGKEREPEEYLPTPTPSLKGRESTPPQPSPQAGRGSRDSREATPAPHPDGQGSVAQGTGAGHASKPLSGAEIKRMLWPIFKRVPNYLRLGLALAREPAIPNRHKALLYGAVVYQVTPIHLIFTPIPVVGQIDTIALLLLGIRQAHAHCPPAIARQHFARLGLPPTQLNRDTTVVLGLGDYTVNVAKHRVGRDFRFVGRVASGVGRRQMGRLFARENEPLGAAGTSTREVSRHERSEDKRTTVPRGPHSGAEPVSA
jgi:uncharacterized membrane protein YkvA (DUF1232 family)